MNRKLIVVIILFIFGGLLGWQIYQRIYAREKRSVPQRIEAVAVEISEVEKTTIRDVEVFVGTLLPKSQFIAAPKIAGRLARIFVNIGDRVKHGQMIALLDDHEYVQQVEQAQAELEVAKANVEEVRSALNLASREFDRARALRAKEVISLAEMDVAESRYHSQQARQKVALAQVAQKEALVKAAQVRFSYTRIEASWPNGDESRVVGERFVDEGAMLRANDPIVSVLDIRSLTAVFHVIERDYGRLKNGQVAVVSTDAFPNKAFTGTIARVAPLLKETARQARVEMDIPNPELLLKPGMFVRIQIEFAKRENATVVPLRSLTKRNHQEGVFLADLQTKRVQFVPVTLGIVSGDWAEVVAPSLFGYVVIVGQQLLDDGSAITLPGKRPAALSSEESTGSRLLRSRENR
ncbi:MAG: efflux RND transporter periplasmic adaptor subunit [Deltaproteobacteria bacterium]|nr:efflux RND transporter periplasmic adaptor subunit [Deltaproteobacteria bacterium]